VDPQHAGHLRIGELSRRVGVSPELLRAWERRYELLRPIRSSGGFRLYSDADEERIRAMQRRLDQGLSAAEAAASALTESQMATPLAHGLADACVRMQEALEQYDETEVNLMFDRLLSAYGTNTVLVEVILPVLRGIGDGWEEGRIAIAQEHFASNVLRGRLLGLSRGWGRATGPVAVLACPPDERHDLALLMFDIALREAGWRIAFLGADTPISTIASATATVRPSAVVINAVSPTPFYAVEDELAALTRRTTVAIGGAGADQALAERLGAVLLHGDPVSAAADFARSFDGVIQSPG
jgi:MerR family transcriptional regulator, light-induced transcriptional regulator